MAVKDPQFETWEWNGEVHTNIGIINAVQMGYTVDEVWHDPPVWSAEFKAWIDSHGCRFFDLGAFGPPGVVFPNQETAELFRQEWFEPGLKHWEAKLAPSQ